MLATIAILMLFGILLVILETFLPGWVAGILGCGFILVAAALFLVAEDFASWSTGMRVLGAAGVLAVAAALLFIWLRSFAGSVFRRSLTLAATSGSRAMPQTVPAGRQGVALTELRPLGRAEIDGRHYDVRCQTGQAAAGVRVEVVATEPGNLLVRLI